jgi:type VI secretion system secreted protein VgrG
MENHEEVYKFTAKDLSDSLKPIHFVGHESIMRPFGFTIKLVLSIERPPLDIAKAIGKECEFSIRKSGKEIGDSWWTVQGLIDSISQVKKSDTVWHYYEVNVIPRLGALAQQRRTRVFQNQTLEAIVSKILKEADITGVTWDIDAKGAAAKLQARQHVVQYEETDLEFITRLCARFGVWYFFSFSDSTKLIFTDVSTTFPLIEGEIPFQPSGETKDSVSPDWHQQEVVTSFRETRSMTPAKATVRGWKPDLPDQIPEGTFEGKDLPAPKFEYYVHSAQVPERSEPGSMDVYKGQPDSTHLARQRVEQFTCQHYLSSGTSDVRSLRAGTVLTIKDRIDGKTERWLVLSVSHHGSQSLGHGGGDGAGKFYRNTFTAIPKNDKIPYRPEERPWPKIPGLLTALVESEGGAADQYANLDTQGRYHVRLAADRENSGTAKASLPVRMMSPYTGKEWGFHLPLHHGAEVLLSHVDGDPDRPVIAGAVPNAATPQVVQSANQSQSRLLTAGNNELTLDDKQGSELIYLHAEKDHETVVENDEQRKIGHNQAQWVANSQTLYVGLPVPGIGKPSAPNPLQGMTDKVHSAAPSAGVYSQLEFVALGSAKIVGGFYQIAVGGAMNTTVGLAKTEQVGLFHHSTVLGYRVVEVGKDFSVSVKGEHKEIAEKDRKIETKKKLLIEAGDEIVIKVGKAKITMKKDGEISIEGKELNIKTTADTIIKSKNVKQN